MTATRMGVPAKDYFPLLALLMRSLTEEEVVKAARTIVRQTDVDTPVSEEQIRAAIHEVIEKEPNRRRFTRSRPGWPRWDGRWKTAADL